jgi:hypothetical protein
VAIIVGVLLFLGLIAWGVVMLISAVAHGEPPIFGLILLALPLLGLSRAIVEVVGERLIRGWRFGGGGGQKTLVGLVVSIFAAGGLVVGAQLMVPSQRPDAQLVAALRPACAGQPVAGAGVWDRTGIRANHLVILDTDGNEHPWTGYPPMAWRPPNLADTELVACISPDEIHTEIQVCRYDNGPPIHRYRVSRSVKVVEAATGRLIAQYNVSDDPRACGPTENRDLTELSGTIGWDDFAEGFQPFVESGQAGQPTPTPAVATPIDNPTPRPPVTEPPAARRIALSAAIEQDLVRATVDGDGLQYIDLQLRSLADLPLIIEIGAGLMLDPQRNATQSMVVIADTEIDLAAMDDGSWDVPVACAEMRRDQPGESDTFDIRTSRASGDLARLLNEPEFGDHQFRVQQFAVWTITNDPLRRNYTPLGSTLSVFGTGPTDDEFNAIRDLLEAADIEPSDYRAFR